MQKLRNFANENEVSSFIMMKKDAFPKENVERSNHIRSYILDTKLTQLIS